MMEVGTAVRSAGPTTFMVAPVAPASAPNDTHSSIEEMAHNENILLSPEALRAIAGHVERAEGDTHNILRDLFEKAKAEYAREDGWILLSQERTRTLLGDTEASAQSTRTDSTTAGNSQPARVAPQSLSPATTGTQEQNGDRNTSTNSPRGVRMDEHRSQNGSKSTNDTAPTRTTTTLESYKQANVSVGAFVEWLVAGNEADTYAHVRKATSQGTSIEQFIGEVVRSLDDV